MLLKNAEVALCAAMTTSEKSTKENPEENLLGIYFTTVNSIGPKGVLDLISKVLKGAVFDQCCRRDSVVQWLLSSACHTRVGSWQDFEYVVARLFESMLIEAFVKYSPDHAENGLRESQQKQADLTLQELLEEEKASQTQSKKKMKRKRKKSMFYIFSKRVLALRLRYDSQ